MYVEHTTEVFDKHNKGTLFLTMCQLQLYVCEIFFCGASRLSGLVKHTAESNKNLKVDAIW